MPTKKEGGCLLQGRCIQLESLMLWRKKESQECTENRVHWCEMTTISKCLYGRIRFMVARS